MDDPWRGEAEELFERLETQNRPPEFFHALRDLIDQRYPRGRGRRKGQDSVDDSARLARLEELLRSGTDDDEAAIKQVAGDDPGDDEKNTIKRLRRKLPRVREALQHPSRAEKDEILRKAFEEDVETWDL